MYYWWQKNESIFNSDKLRGTMNHISELRIQAEMPSFGKEGPKRG